MKNVRFCTKILRIMVPGPGGPRLSLTQDRNRLENDVLGSLSLILHYGITTPVSQKHLLWAAFNASRAIAFTPLYFLSPTIISHGALYALATLASTTWCNMTATTSADLESGDQIWLLTTAVLMASQVAPVALPAGLRGPSIPQAFPLLNAILFSGHQIVCVLHEGGINEQTAVVITGINLHSLEIWSWAKSLFRKEWFICTILAIRRLILVRGDSCRNLRRERTVLMDQTGQTSLHMGWWPIVLVVMVGAAAVFYEYEEERIRPTRRQQSGPGSEVPSRTTGWRV
ncbi:bax inhibitor family protein [Moniliophthora roreri MCA 2997]|uniref:Bax inhibitor family protein n=1 Tax=Moniliophthora roreri (strain MCA 2997) TaxID=1381753 RepID=V2WTE0_MONRO|nr:bax inhibitor family protein [Moniliophthora roreri MCA 2997]